MTTRVVLFKGHTNWLMTPEFIGDRAELAQESATRSCDKNWTAIARRFTQAKTKDEFSEVSTWAQGLYHDTAGEQAPKKIRVYKRPDEMPDEVLVVHEDLGVSGLHTLGVCPTCGRTHFVTFRPDKTTLSTGMRCLTCAAKLQLQGQLPSQEEWAAALDKYNAPTPSYRVSTPDDFPHISQKLWEYAASKKDEPAPSSETIAAGAREWLREEMRDQNAAKNMGKPVKISKIVQYTGGEFLFEVIFRDWSSALLRSRYLIPLDNTN